MPLSRGLSSEWIIPPCVRACVRPSPILGEAQNICFCTILSEISENHLCILQYLATVAFKTQHKIDTFFVKCSKHTIKWEVEIVNFNTSQLKSYVKSSNIKTSQLKPYTFHSLSSLCPTSLTFLPPLSSSWLWLHSQSLSVTLGHPLFEFILMHLFRGLSSKLIIPPCVRPCVRASVPLLGEAQNICFCTILSEISENHLCILQYLATVALKTQHKIDTFFVKCSKHTIKWEVEIVNFNTSQLKS